MSNGISSLAKRVPELSTLNSLFSLCSQGSGLIWKIHRGGTSPAGGQAGSIHTGLTGKQYWQVKISKNIYKVHRIVWSIANNMEIPIDCMIDHIDGNGLNNDPCNLRISNYSNNNKNLSGARVDSKSGILGVSWHKQRRKWNAQIRSDGRVYNLGYFKNINDAVLARRAGELKYWGFGCGKINEVGR